MKKIVLVIIFLNFCFPFCWPVFAGKKAFLVGINKYPYASSSVQLFGCLNDVRMLKNILIKNYGFTEKEIKILVDENATRQNIISTFENWLIDGTRNGDLVIFYYSGHGSQVQDFNGDEADGKDEVFCPYDTVPVGGKNIITDDEMGVILRKLKGRDVVVIIDACHSGGLIRGVGNKIMALEETPARHVRYLPITGYEPTVQCRDIPCQDDIPSGLIFICACREDEPALEINDAEGWIGGFTNSLLQESKNVKITYRELFERTRKHMKAPPLSLPQTPQLIPLSGEKVNKLLIFQPIEEREEVSKPSEAVFIQQQGQMTQPGLSQSQQPTTATPAAQPAEKPGASVSTQVASPEPVEHDPGMVSQQSTAVESKLEETKKKSETLLVALESIEGATAAEVNEIREQLRRISYLKLVESGSYFDRLLRGKVVKGKFKIRVVNRIGDAFDIPEAKTIQDLVKNLMPSLEYAFIVKRLTQLKNPGSPFEVRAWVADEERQDFRVGELITFNVRSSKDCYIVMLNLDSNGNFDVIFPNKYYGNGKEFKAKAGITYTFPDEKMRKNSFLFQIQSPAGEEIIKVIATTKPLDLQKLGIDKFKFVFETNSQPKGPISFRRVVPIKAIAEELEKIEWSEDTVVIRTYE